MIHEEACCRSHGLLLVFGGLYIVVGERLVGTSADATINAHVVTLRAPIDGTLSFSIRNIGARVEQNSEIAAIYNSRYDTARLRDLERQLVGRPIDLISIAARKTAVADARAKLDLQSKAYQVGRVHQLDAELAEGQAALQAALARQREANSALQRTRGPVGRGL